MSREKISRDGFERRAGVACRPQKADYPGQGNKKMRYVIGVCLVTGFLIWDAASNEGRFLDSTVRELHRLTSMLRD